MSGTRWFTRLVIAALILAAGVTAGIPPAAFARSGPDSLVTGFDLEAFVRSRLPGFELTRMSPVWDVGLEALAVEPASREILHVTVGVFGSSGEAAQAASARVADFSIRLDHGSLSGKELGAASWSADLTVVFYRDNVLVQIFGSSRERVQAIAETVDKELDRKGDHVERGGRVSRPAMSGLRSPAGNLAVGGETEIRLSASSAAGRTVFYAYNPSGGELVGGDPPVSLWYRPNTPGSHVLRFAAVDNRCVVSAALEMPVTVVEAGGQ